jgi:HK97 family phage prohead protease
MHYRFDTPAEFKLDGENRATVIGYASTFGNTDLAGDIIEAGAFKACIDRINAKGGTIPMLDSHKVDSPIGVWTRLEETERGLMAEGRLTMSVQRAAEVRDLINDGAIRSLSIGFVARNDHYDRERNARIIEEIDLKEISTVVFPANPQADITALKLAPMIETPRDFEYALREIGFSRNAAKSITARGFMSDLRDEADELDVADLRDAIATLKKTTQHLKRKNENV